MDIGAIEHAYRRYARVYDIVFGGIFQPGRKAIVERMAFKPGERVLEVGVGTGLSFQLYPKHILVAGIDISRDMLAVAQARQARAHKNVHLFIMDAENMAFRDSSFDKVVAMYVASVVPNLERLVDEMRRVCKPEGKLIFVNHFHSQNPLLGGFESLISRWSDQLGFHPDLSRERLMEKIGRTTTDIRPVNVFNFSTMVEAVNNKRCDIAQ